MRKAPSYCYGVVFPCLAALLAGGCATQTTVVNASALSNGFSGMAMIDDTHYLAVHDELSHESGARISVLEVAADRNINITSVTPANWKHNAGRSNDLEGVCAIPKRDGEFLLVEAGHYDGDFGRMFHVKVDITKATHDVEVLYAFDLPEFDPKGRSDPAGDEIEGIACATRSDGQTLVILGERGGSSVYPSGLLRWVVIDLDAPGALQFSEAGSAGKSVDAPGSWSDPTKNRDISALHLDSDNNLWAAASEDLGDSGPFKSIVYKVAELKADDPDPVQIAETLSVSHTVDGFKVESLAAPTNQAEGSVFAIGTEDEVFGGVWRALK